MTLKTLGFAYVFQGCVGLDHRRMIEPVATGRIDPPIPEPLRYAALFRVGFVVGIALIIPDDLRNPLFDICLLYTSRCV